jgi:hypothetical protein
VKQKLQEEAKVERQKSRTKRKEKRGAGSMKAQKNEGTVHDISGTCGGWRASKQLDAVRAEALGKGFEPAVSRIFIESSFDGTSSG